MFFFLASFMSDFQFQKIKLKIKNVTKFKLKNIWGLKGVLIKMSLIAFDWFSYFFLLEIIKNICIVLEKIN